MIWTSVQHAPCEVRLVLSDQRGPDVDLLLRTNAAEELGRALFAGGHAPYLDAMTVDGDRAVVSVAGDEIRVAIKGGSAMVFVLDTESTNLGARLLSRPVASDVECPSCGRTSRSILTVAPSSAVADAQAQHAEWICPSCGTNVAENTLVQSADEVWRVRNESP